MDDDNTVYTVTFPDICISYNGPIIACLNISDSEISEYRAILESVIQSTQFVLYQTTTKKDELAWKLHVTNMAQIIIINIDDVSPEDIAIAIDLNTDSRKNVIFVSEDGPSSVQYVLASLMGITPFNSKLEAKKYLKSL